MDDRYEEVIVKYKSYTEAAFEELRDNDLLEAELPYEVLPNRQGRGEPTLWAWSPDGIGCYWYDSLEELLEQHG